MKKTNDSSDGQMDNMAACLLMSVLRFLCSIVSTVDIEHMMDDGGKIKPCFFCIIAERIQLK